MEIKIHVSSESSRIVNKNNTPSNFTTVFDRPLMLNQNKTYFLALDKIETMSYSWNNISEFYKNNKIRYGKVTEDKGTMVINYKDIEFSPGCYSYEDINTYIKGTLSLNNDSEVFLLTLIILSLEI